jgi:SAM-dependent methyltransferase
MPLTRFQASLLRLRNRIDYPLRQFFHWQRGGYHPRSGAKAGLYAGLPPASREQAEALAQRYRQEYALETLYANSTSGAYREALFYLDMLVTALERSNAALPDPLAAADIGPSTWFYVQSLYAGLRGWKAPHNRRVFLTGFEADPYRVYNDFYSRQDHALGNMRGLDGVTYRPEAFTRQPAAFDLITLFFPFVFEDDHLEWGLPSDLFQPQRLLADAWDSLKPGGTLFIVNQGLEEHEAQTQMLAQLGVRPVCTYRQEDLLFRYDLDRYVLVARHD